MIKLSNFVSSALQIALGQDVILSSACGRSTAVQPQVENRGGTVTQRWRGGLVYLCSDVRLWDASAGTSRSGSVRGHWRAVDACQGHLPSALAALRGWMAWGDLAPCRRGAAALWAWPAAAEVGASRRADVLRLAFPPLTTFARETGSGTLSRGWSRGLLIATAHPSAAKLEPAACIWSPHLLWL